MTGFGRTGRWFGLDHWGVQPDLLVAAKGATSGYWPFGFVAASGRGPRRGRAGPGFVHGFTYSHGPVAAAVASEVLRILEDEDLVEASATKGERLAAGLVDGARRAPERRRDPRAWPARRGGARRGPRDARALSRAADRLTEAVVGARGSVASWSTRGRATRTARTATRSCWGRRSSSRTRSSAGSSKCWGRSSRPRWPAGGGAAVSDGG